MLQFGKFLNVWSTWSPQQKQQPATMAQTRAIVNFIQSVGKLPINHHNLESKAEKIIEYIRCFPKSLAIQRAGCHTISNIAMDLEPALLLMEKGCSDLVIDALIRFGEEDWRICWLGCSAIWNLARPEEFRHKFNPQTVDLILKILEKYKTTTRVCNTAIGALSNISLDNGLKTYVGQLSTITKLLKIIDANVHDKNVASTAAGLLANLAVHDAIADRLVEGGCIFTLTAMLNTRQRNSTFQRNCAAALSNVITSPLFIRECLEFNTVETMLDLHMNANNMGIVALLMNCFNALDVNPESPTTTAHLCIRHGHTNLLQSKIIDSIYDGAIVDVNKLDGNGNSLLEAAAARHFYDCVEFLVKCGARLAVDDFSDSIREECIEPALMLVQKAHDIYKREIHRNMKVSPDLANVITKYIPAPDMLMALNML